MKVKIITGQELVESYYELVKYLHKNHIEILREYQIKSGNKPLKLPMLEYYKNNPEMVYLITGNKQ